MNTMAACVGGVLDGQTRRRPVGRGRFAFLHGTGKGRAHLYVWSRDDGAWKFTESIKVRTETEAVTYMNSKYPYRSGTTNYGK